MNEHRSDRSKVRGGSSTALLLGLVCSAALVVAAFVWLLPAHEAHPTRVEELPTATSKPTLDPPLARVEREAPRVPTPMDPPAPALGPERFEGSGRIQGEVLVGEHVHMPTDWTLIIEPSPTLIGAERAVEKRVAFLAGERTFDVPNLPLAGYGVRAEAPGLNFTTENVLLVRGSEAVFVTLRFTPTGLVDGRVLAPDGAPADGVSVVLEHRTTHVRTTVVADANGAYLFRDVPDGEYRLYVGSPESPLVPPGDLLFRAPSLRFRDLTLPPTGTLIVETRAENGSPVANAEVSGFGSMGGTLRLHTDYAGRAIVPWLLPGEYRLEAKLDDGRSGRTQTTVRVDTEPSLAVVHLR